MVRLAWPGAEARRRGAEGDDARRAEASRGEARAQAAGELIADYQQQELIDLLERLREGFVLLDGGRIGALELDALIARYTRAAGALREFCGSANAEREHAARELEAMRLAGENPDWWEAGGTS
jgi:hypothetical protein